ncbi:MAG: YhdP family protein [Pseudomonadales bacterium]
MPQRILKLLTRWLWGGIVLAIVFTSLYVTLGRYYLPQLSRFQDVLLEEINSLSGLDIQVQAMEGTWHAFSPQIELVGFRVAAGDKSGRPAIEVDQLMLRLDANASVFALAPLLERVSLINPVLHVYQQADGVWWVGGFEPGKGNSNDFIQRLIETATFVDMQDLQINFHPLDEPPWHLQEMSLQVRSGLNMRQMVLTLVDGNGDAVVTMDLESQGKIRDKGFRLRGQASFEDVDLAPYVAISKMSTVSQQLTASGDISLDWVRGERLIIQGELNSPGFELLREGNEKGIALNNFSTRFGTEILGGKKITSWLHGLSLDWQGNSLSLSKVLIEREELAQPWRFSIPELQLEYWSRWLINTGELPEMLADTLATLAPKGAIRNLSVGYHPGKPVAEALQLKAILDDVSIEPWKSAPGARVFGYIEASALSGGLWIKDQPLSLFLPKLYDHAFEIASVSGQAAWWIEPDGVRVASGPLTLASDFGSGRGHITLEFPAKRTGLDPQMSLMISLNDSDAKFRDVFIPKLVSSNLKEWLDDSLRGAKVPDAGFIYQGSLKGGEFDRSIQLMLNAAEGVVRYDPLWPKATEISALLFVDNYDTRVDVHSAMMYGSSITDTDVSINRVAGHLELDVSGTLTGPAKDIPRLFVESPLRKVLGDVIEPWQASGRYNAKLNLKLPLIRDGEPQVGVRANLEGVKLTNQTLNLSFDNVSGPLNYSSEKGLVSSGLKATLWDRPIDANIVSRGAGKKIETEVSVTGQVTALAVRDWLELPVLGLFHGQAPFEAVLRVNALDDGGSRLDLRTDLFGVSTDLPPPFIKAEVDLMPLAMRLSLSEPSLPMTGTLAGVGEFQMELNGPDGVRGLMHVGAAPMPSSLPDSGLLVEGSLEHADLDKWLSAVDLYQAVLEEMSAASGVAEQGVAATSVRVDKLNLRSFNAFGQYLTDVDIIINPDLQSWLIDVEHSRVKAHVRVEDEDQPLQIKVDYLHFPINPEQVLPEGDLLEGTDPREYVAMDAELSNVSVSEVDFGSWKFKFRPTETGALISGLSASMGGMTLRGLDEEEGAELQWFREGSKERSSFMGVLMAGNIREVLAHYDMDPGVSSKKAVVLADIEWGGSPVGIGLEGLSGDLQLELQDGRFYQTEGTAADGLKLISLLNFSNLVRRLQLDFKDVTETGLEYKRVKGILEFEPGWLKIEEPLHVEGPSSDLKLTGTLDLHEETVAAELVAIIPVGSNLPWMAALVGGIPVAAGVFLASKLFEEQIEKLSSAVYSINGPWDDPKMKFEHLFERTKK